MKFQTTQVPAVAALPTHGGNPCANAGATDNRERAPVKRCGSTVNLNFYSRAAGETFAKTRVALTQWQP